MILLKKDEVQRLIKEGKNKNLKKTCHRYYMPNDDSEALDIVATMRGYDSKMFYEKYVEGLRYV